VSAYIYTNWWSVGTTAFADWPSVGVSGLWYSAAEPPPPHEAITSTNLAGGRDDDDEGLGGAAPRRPARRLPQAGVPRGHARRGARVRAVARRRGRRARAVAPGRRGHRQAVVARLARDGAWRRGPRRRPVRRLHRTGRRRLAALSTREVSTALLIIASFWHVLVGAKVHAVDT